MPMEKDPVCGMDVDPNTAVGKSEFMGKVYHFCSAACKQKFDQDPGQYLHLEEETKKQK